MMNFLQKIFSITKEYHVKYLTILGAKIELKSNKQRLEYLDWLLKQNAEKSTDCFVPITDTPINNEAIKTKLIAYYLPQYHSFDLNDRSFGKGFTEWTNVTKAIPHFIGHNQPHLPYDVGFYDLSNPDIMYRQVELAKMYGIYGFCFHYYWFSGKRLLEKPIFNYLEHQDLDFPFCFCWANENWAKLWDGGNKEVIMEQNFKKEETEMFFNDILPFFNDKRYIRIDGKPVLIFYRPQIFKDEDVVYFVKHMQELAVKHGFNGVYIISAITPDKKTNLSKLNFDAEVEFPPHCMPNLKRLKFNKQYINRYFKSIIYNVDKWVAEKQYYNYKADKLFKCVFPNWDNTARKAYTKGAVLQLTPKNYKTWLKDCIIWTKQSHSPNEQYVFINAWNEWGEGAHLEPDQKFGYAYLQATKEALEELH